MAMSILNKVINYRFIFSVEFFAPFIFLTFLSNMERKRGKMNSARSSAKKNRFNIKDCKHLSKAEKPIKNKEYKDKMIFGKDS